MLHRTRLALVISALAVATGIIVPVVTPVASALSTQAVVDPARSGTTVVSVATGFGNTCAVLKGGTLKCWGENGTGQLGLGDTVDRGDNAREMGDYLPPVNLGPGVKVTAVDVSNTYACALTSTGKVKCWGDNTYGQLGLGDSGSVFGDELDEIGSNLPFVSLGSGRKARAITLGGSHTCVLLDNGAVKCWGRNSLGQVGIGNTAVPRDEIGDSFDEIGNGSPTVDLGPGRKAKAVAAGDDHTCAMLDNGTVKCWGDNTYGQLGYGDINGRGSSPAQMGNNLPAVDLGPGRKAKAIAASGRNTCVILDNSSVKCWGYNAEGELGIGTTTSHGDSSASGHEMGAGLPAVDLGSGRKAKAITAGTGYACALLDNKTMKCWGDSTAGQLGYGINTSKGTVSSEMGDNLLPVDLGAGLTPVAINAGGLSTCAVLANSTLKCWGFNWAGHLGYGDLAIRGDGGSEMGNNLPSINLGVRVVQVAVGASHACAILENKTVECWGKNDYGQLGYDDTVPRGDGIDRGGGKGLMGDSLPTVNLGPGSTPVSIAAGYNHTCVLLDDKTMRCWGSNSHGQLGTGNKIGNAANIGDQTGEMASIGAVPLGDGRTTKAIFAGAENTCAILDNGALKCWGLNAQGQLGLGDTVDRGDSGIAGHLMGNSLPAVQLGNGRKAKAVSIGFIHTCAILDNGALKCWGNNSLGTLGLGNLTSRGDSGAAGHEMGNGLPAVQLGARRKAKAVSAGYGNTCVVLDNGAVKCWGVDAYGVLGGRTGVVGFSEHQMGNNLDPVDLGAGRKAIAVSVMNRHACALLVGGAVKCWGSGDGGGLGHGDTLSRGRTSDGMGDQLAAVRLGTDAKAISIGSRIGGSCALLADRRVKCWGVNTSGQLGLGDSLDRGDGPDEMGDLLPNVAFTG